MASDRKMLLSHIFFRGAKREYSCSHSEAFPDSSGDETTNGLANQPGNQTRAVWPNLEVRVGENVDRERLLWPLADQFMCAVMTMRPAVAFFLLSRSRSMSSRVLCRLLGSGAFVCGRCHALLDPAAVRRFPHCRFGLCRVACWLHCDPRNVTNFVSYFIQSIQSLYASSTGFVLVSRKL